MAVALSAHRFPPFNGFFQNGQFKPSSDVHAGVATAIRGGGLASPAIHNSDQLTLDELMARMRDLITRAQRPLPQLGNDGHDKYRLQPG
jgi:pyruvate dehydrogenase E2 component (dihydrolipoamide acetyltransferase)